MNTGESKQSRPLQQAEVRDAGGIFAYDVRFQPDHSRRRTYSFLSPEQMEDADGLTRAAIIGFKRDFDGPDNPENFVPNQDCIDLIHSTLSNHAADFPRLAEAAIRQKDGYVYVMDGRTPTPAGEVPPEDIIGAVLVSGGTIRSYQSSPNYSAFGKNGLMRLDPWIRERMLQAIALRKQNPTG